MYKILCAIMALFPVSSVYGRGALLPMEYYSPQNSVSSEGSRILMGTEPEINAQGEFAINPSSVLFVAPHSSRVSASGFQKYITANCGVVENELSIEKVSSDILLRIIGELDYWSMELVSQRDELIKAREACSQAKKSGSADLSACDYRRALSEMMQETAEMIGPWEMMATDIADKSNTRLEALGRTPGGYIAVNANLYDSQEIENVKRANRGYDVRTVPFSDIVFHFSPAADDINANLSRRTTLGYYLAGESSAQPTASGSTQAVTALKTGAAVDLGVTLSRIGACQKDFLRTGSFVYKFPAYGYLNGFAKYNKWQVYERIEQNQSKGGFLSTKTVHSLFEDMKSDKSFQFSVVSDGIVDADEMKERIQARLLAEMINEYMEVQLIASPRSATSLPNPPQNGADYMGDALLKNCPHVYCMIGGLSLKSLSAIAGKSTSRDEFKKSINVSTTESWNYTTRYEAYDSSTTLISLKL